MVTAWLLLSALALAQQEPDPVIEDVPLVPSAGIATEGGPGTLWVAPANLAYDPDQTWGAFVRYHPDDGYTTSFGAAYGVGGLGVGFRVLTGLDARPDFTLDLGLGVKLPQRVAIGGALHWNLLYQQRNYVAFDANVAWRPLPWFGMAILTRNIGDPGGLERSVPQTGGGFAIRPLGKLLLVGLDYVHTFGGQPPFDVVASTFRVRPLPGFFVRAGLDSRLRFGMGVELYFGGAGFGLHAGTDDWQGVPSMVAWVGSDERDEHLSPSHHQFDALVLEEAPPYTAERRLLRREAPTWLDTLEQFNRAATTPGVQGMLVTLGDMSLSWARWTELRDAIRRIRNDGREVVVLLTGTADDGAVYAASAATRVLVHPAATIALTGPSLERTYLRGLLDGLGVDVQVVRRSDYKSAGETYTELGPSDAARQADGELLDDLYTELVTTLAQGRARTEDDVRGWIDGGPWTASEAVERGIADARAYPDQALGHLESIHGSRIKLVELADRPIARSAWEAPVQLAVIYVEGTIVRGASSPGGLLGGPRAGSGTVVDQLEAAGKDVKTRAVVLRVDSPGGSSFAADEIWRAVERLRASGKPVVVSMGGVATSGGYYVAAGADAIWAEPTTVTGSIGVIAMKPSVGGLFERLGVTSWRDGRGRNATMDALSAPWDPLQEARMQAMVDETYAMFKERVARGRDLAPEAVEAAAQGRVWSGRAARDLGLVDHLGSLQDALADARRLAGIPEKRAVEVVGLRTRRTLSDILLPDLSSLGTQAAMVRIDRTLSRLRTTGWSQGPLGPLAGLLTVAGEEHEVLWMLDPGYLDAGPR